METDPAAVPSMAVHHRSGRRDRIGSLRHVHLRSVRPSDVHEIQSDCGWSIWVTITVRTEFLLKSHFNHPAETAERIFRVIAISALHLYYLHMEIVSGNPTLTGSFTVVCAQLELGYGIMASSIPCLKPFMSAYEGPLRPPHKSSGHQSSGDYPFTTYGSGHSKRLRSKEVGLSTGGSGMAGSGTMADERALRPDQAGYQATISHRDPTAEDGAGSIDSGDSRQMIIRKDLVIKKEVKWSVERDGEGEETEEKGSDASVRVVETHPR